MEIPVSGFGRVADFSESCSNKIWDSLKIPKLLNTLHLLGYQEGFCSSILELRGSAVG